MCCHLTTARLGKSLVAQYLGKAKVRKRQWVSPLWNWANSEAELWRAGIKCEDLTLPMMKKFLISILERHWLQARRCAHMSKRLAQIAGNQKFCRVKDICKRAQSSHKEYLVSRWSKFPLTRKRLPPGSLTAKIKDKTFQYFDKKVFRSTSFSA